jgi:hypothetical protein
VHSCQGGAWRAASLHRSLYNCLQRAADAALHAPHGIVGHEGMLRHVMSPVRVHPAAAMQAVSTPCCNTLCYNEQHLTRLWSVCLAPHSGQASQQGGTYSGGYCLRMGGTHCPLHRPLPANHTCGRSTSPQCLHARHHCKQSKAQLYTQGGARKAEGTQRRHKVAHNNYVHTSSAKQRHVATQGTATEVKQLSD